MKRYFAILAVALTLGGCASLDPGGKSILSGGTSITAPITNPIGRKELYQIENGMTAVVAGLVGYRRLCLRGLVDTHCRGNIERVQGYTRPLAALLPDLRSAIRRNDQISAVKLFNEARALLSNAQRDAVTMGVTL